MDYTSYRQLAYDQIQDKGCSITITRPEHGGTENPITGSTTGATASADYSTYALITNYGDREIDGTNIKVGDKNFLVPALNLDIIPCATDVITEGNNTWTIVKITTIDPGGSGNELLYKIQCRK